jgi:hypothetical protein
MKPELRICAGIVTICLLGAVAASGSSHAAFVQGRLSKEKLNGILAEAHAEQTDATVPADLLRDSRGLGAALNTFQKNFGGASGFFRNPQVRPPAVTHLISDLQKRLGKELTPKEPADVATMVGALDECIAYLSSPMLVSYMSPDVAQVTRRTAENTLQNMNEASTAAAGAGLHPLLAKTKDHLSQAASLEKNRARIPEVVATIQGIESALDQGSAATAVEGWKKLKSVQPVFPFAQEYLNANQSLMSDVSLDDACEARLGTLASSRSQQSHAQELLTAYKCRELAADQRPNTIAFLNQAEPGIRQDVTKDFGMLPAREDLAGWLDANQRLSSLSPESTQPQRIAAITDLLALKGRYATLPATSTMISQKVDQQVQALQRTIASAPSCDLGDYHVPNAAKGREALTAQLTKLHAQADALRKSVAQCATLAHDSAAPQPVLALLQTDIQSKIKRNADQLQIGNDALQALNSRSVEVDQELQHLDELKATHAAELEAQKRAEQHKEAALAAEKDSEACNLLGTKMGYSAQARKEQAEKATQNAYDKLGPDIIYDSVGGDNNRYMLIAATPQHESVLEALAAAMVDSKSTRAGLCAQGFSEVQFIVRFDDGVNQKLIKRVRLSFHESMRYSLQTAGATPEP